MDQSLPSSDGSLRSLEGYIRRRLQFAGGGLLGEDAGDGDPLRLLKSVYLLPLDELAAEFAEAGRSLVSFATYDYAGLANDGRIKQAACEAVMSIGIGAGASRMVGGERVIHADLERDLAEFFGLDDAVVLVSGYMTNVSLVGHLMSKNDVILVDDLSHNSIIVGTDVSRARIIRFAHNDLDDLESLLRQVRGEAHRVLIIVEGLYSMDGDIADLPRLVELKHRYDAWLMVDEAHSLGVLGRSGRGVSEHFAIAPREIDIIVGTLSKTLGACGGFIAASKSVIDWLRFTLPAFVFSVGMSPVLAASARQAIAILRAEPWRVGQVQENSRLFLCEARRRGLDTGPAIGAGVVSVLFSNQQECMGAARRLLAAGFFAPPILQLAVPKDKPRIRFFLSAAHTTDQIVSVVETLAGLAENAAVQERSRRRSRRATVVPSNKAKHRSGHGSSAPNPVSTSTFG